MGRGARGVGTEKGWEGGRWIAGGGGFVEGDVLRSRIWGGRSVGVRDGLELEMGWGGRKVERVMGWGKRGIGVGDGLRDAEGWGA